MKKIIVITTIFLLFLGLSSQAPADNFKAGFGASYYAPTDLNFKEPYGTGSMMFTASLGLNLSERLELRGEFNYFSTKGKMTLSKEEITYIFMPIAMGFRHKVFKAGRISPYLGLGADLCSYKEKVPERFGKKVTGSKVGFHGELGVHVKLAKVFYLDFNLRYINVNDEPFKEGIKRRLGGLRAGIGVEYWY